MKHTISYIAVLLFAMMAGGGLTASNRSGLDIYINGNDTIGQAKESYHWAIADTAAYMEEYRQNQNRNYDSKISLLARTYGDSIVLRWAPEDYVSWKYLNRVGVNIYRFDADNPIKVDTVAYALKPQPIEAWRAAYPQTDSIAGIAMGTLYGEGGFTQEQSKSRPGTMGAVLDVHAHLGNKIELLHDGLNGPKCQV